MTESGSLAGVFAEQTAEPARDDYRSIGLALGWESGRRHQGETAMRSGVVVMVNELPEDALEVALAEDDHPIEAFAASAATPLANSVAERWGDRKGVRTILAQ